MSALTDLKIRTTCSYCGVGCGIVVSKENNGALTVAGDITHPANKGRLCSKGMNLNYVVSKTDDRLTHPQMRWNKHHPLQQVSWDVAIKRATKVFKTITDKYGPDSVGFYVSGQMLTEEYYIVNKLAKAGFKTNNIDTNSRLCMSSAVVGYKKSLGEDAVPLSYEDIELSDCMFITGANPAWCHPILFRRIEDHKEKNPDVKIIVADPRKTQTCSLADLHLQLKPGTDTILNNAIGRALIEGGYTDDDFVANHADGYEEYKRIVFETELSLAEEITGVSVEDIKLAAKYIGEAKGYISLWAMGLNQSNEGVNKNISLLNLSYITGQIGKPGSGPFSLTGQPNAMGGREVGGMSNLLPAHRDLANPAHREEVANFWGVDSIPDKPGYTATEMFDAILEGKLKAIWIICTNPMVSLPNSNKVEQALKKAKFVVVQDISKNADTLEHADLVLPAAGWLEKEGVMTNSDRRISHVKKVVDAPGEALSDSEILLRFAKGMQFEGFDFDTPESVFEEHKQLTKNTNCDITGLTYSHLIEKGTAQWPFPEGATTGTKRLFEDKKFYTPNGKVQILPAEGLKLIEPTSDEFPLILTTSRIRDHWHTMTRTGKVNKLSQHISLPTLEIHKETAAERGIKNGTTVEVYSQQGLVKVQAKVTEDILPGVVCLPMHWGKTLMKSFSRTNNITKTEVDPVSKEPDFKYTSVQVRVFEKKKENIVIVGAGASAYKFIMTYRKKNKTDEIKVFSKEEDIFYNRVLLADYLRDETPWKKVAKVNEAVLKKLGVDVYKGNAIISVNTKTKEVVDSDGVTYPYDRLILATGRRSKVPADFPLDLKGMFTVRNKKDIENLKTIAEAGKHATIIGGGLLGLELAGSLRHLGLDVSLVTSAGRVMNKQLDTVASELVQDELESRGINCFYNDTVQTVNQVDGSEKLQLNLKSGTSFKSDIAIFAMGTEPTTFLAKDAGIECNRGVIVDEYFETSTQNVYALGEIAEFNNSIFGTREAAEEQGDILANYIAGDDFSFYSGSLVQHILKVPALDLCAMGIISPPKDDPRYEEIVITDRRSRFYKKCIVKDDILVGAVLLGDKFEFKDFKELIQEKIELGDKRQQLLRSAENENQVVGKLVCSCNGVGEGNITKAIIDGVTDFKDLCVKTTAGMKCGSCKPEVKAILESATATHE